MKLNVSIGKYNDNGVSTTIEDSSDESEYLCVVESYSCSPQEACRRSAMILRKAADKFDLLAKQKSPMIFNRRTHIQINNKRRD